MNGLATRNATAILSIALAMDGIFACTSSQTDPMPGDLDERLSRLVQVPMVFEAGNLPEKKKELLRTLIAAGKLIHEAYLRQTDPSGVALRDSFAQREDELGKKLHRFVVRNGGTYDKMDHFKNIFGRSERPPGACFYPADLTQTAFKAYLEKHPDRRDKLMSPYAVVRRQGEHLEAVPYGKEYVEWIEPAAALLKKAAALADNGTLRTYLSSRAQALLTDDYYRSDLDWLDLKGSDIDVIIGPYEVYEDGLMGIKAAYEVTIGLKDEASSGTLEVFTSHLEALESNLPHDARLKRSIRCLVSPMVVVSDIYRGGDIATGYQAVAANLPNDPRVHTTKGTKKTFWKNMLDARFEHILVPLGRALIASHQVKYLTADGVFNFVLLHEICHALGPRYVHGTGESVTVNQAFSELHSALEEGKADVAGLHSMRYFVDKGILPVGAEREVYVSYLASLFRTVRFGSVEAHGRAALCELNFFGDRGGLSVDASTGKWLINFKLMEHSVSELANEWLTTQATGDYNRAKAFLAKWGTMPSDMEAALESVAKLPADIEPVYSVNWN